MIGIKKNWPDGSYEKIPFLQARFGRNQRKTANSYIKEQFLVGRNLPLSASSWAQWFCRLSSSALNWWQLCNETLNSTALWKRSGSQSSSFLQHWLLIIGWEWGGVVTGGGGELTKESPKKADSDMFSSASFLTEGWIGSKCGVYHPWLPRG